MSKPAIAAVVFSIGILGLHAGRVEAATGAVVGPPTCQPGPPHFATIQAAVNAAPAGSTVLVCPGTYPEQIVINKSLTLQGVVDEAANAGLSVVTVPAGGLLANFTSPVLGPEAAQLVVRDTQRVVIQNLTFDGGKLPCPDGVNRTVGIKLFNIGDPTWVKYGYATAGTVKNVVVRNHYACGKGNGIDSEDTYVTIDSNEVHDIDFESIVQIGGNNTIVSNTIQSGVYGIQLYGASKSMVLYNQVATAAGIWLKENTTGVLVSLNQIGPFVGSGIFIHESSGNNVSYNRVSASYAGLYMYRAARNTVKGNRFSYGNFGIANEISLGGNVLTDNVIIEANFGLFYTAPNGDTFSPNTYTGVKVLTTNNPF